MIPNNNSGIGQATPSAGSGEDRIDIHGTPPAVTRVSRRAVLLAGVFGASLGLVVLMLGFGDHSAPRKDGPADENAIRPSAIGKKNWLFIGEAEAGERSAILYTIIESCRRHAIDPYAYLRDVLTRLPTMTNWQIKVITPAAWAHAQRTALSAAA